MTTNFAPSEKSEEEALTEEGRSSSLGAYEKAVCLVKACAKHSDEDPKEYEEMAEGPVVCAA